MKLTDLIYPGSPEDFNSGLSPADRRLLVSKVGSPGKLTANCSNPSIAVLQKVKTGDLGPFKVTGLSPLVDNLQLVFAEIKAAHPQHYKEIRTEGMLCVRKVRGGNSFSIHSWGCAIDLKFGPDVAPFGQKLTHRGVKDVYYIFHRYGWYWGAGFERCDAMHFEASAELLKRVL